MNKLISIVSLFAATTAIAQDEETLQLAPFQVIGSQEEVFDLPGSGSYFGPDELELLSTTNINDVLRQSPGVYVRDEDGYGLFPNISIRGVDTNRSGKVTLLEDGIPTAPAPYSAPSAYYSPTAGRMHAIEVLKGSSQVQYGPHTTGGVVNYVSTPIPAIAQRTGKVYIGTDGALGGHFTFGNQFELGNGSLGSLVEVYREEAEGFRSILPATNGSYKGSDDTGYEKNDLMLKLRYTLNTENTNIFEFKAGTTEFEANETYLGLNMGDLMANPTARYAASAADQIETKHNRSYLRHIVEFDNQSSLASTVYYNNFARDWYKLDKVNGSNPAQVIMSDPGVLKGDTKGDFKIKSNDREYYLFGIESKYRRFFQAGETLHTFEAGVRYHKDKIDRFQDANTFENVYAGNFFGAASKVTGPSSEGDREQESESIALFVEDRIEFDQWVLSPGVRWESVDWNYIRRDKKDPAQTGSGSYSIFAPGIGFEFNIDDDSKFFGGYHRGYSVPSPSSKRKQYDEEISDSIELGYRQSLESGYYFEAVAFHTLLKDLIVEDSLAGGPGDGNVGDVDTLGLEFLIGADLKYQFGTEFGLPVRLAYTYTEAELSSLASSSNPESIFSLGQIGSQVPYVPENQINFTSGIEFENFRAYLSANYTSERYADSRNSGVQENASGTRDARFGRLGKSFTIDLSAFYTVNEDLEIFATVTNLSDEVYLSSRIPHGPRAGAPRQAKTGINFNF